LRTKHIHTFENIENFKKQLLIWAQQFDDVVWLDSNNYDQQYSSYDAVLAVDAFTAIQTDYYQGFEKLKEYQTLTEDWIFGYLTYDLKNDVERLESKNHDGLGVADLCFFQPKKLFFISGNQVEIKYLNAVDDTLEEDLKAIQNSQYKFASFVKLQDKYVLCASPERYIKKEGQRMISQPIKGTAKRSQDQAEDLSLKNRLKTDEKERSENIMIVDLVRNDLSKTALKGTVNVEELCKIYTFDQVHQMISTVTSQVDANTHPVDIIKRYAFVI